MRDFIGDLLDRQQTLRRIPSSHEHANEFQSGVSRSACAVVLPTNLGTS